MRMLLRVRKIGRIVALSEGNEILARYEFDDSDAATRNYEAARALVMDLLGEGAVMASTHGLQPE